MLYGYFQGHQGLSACCPAGLIIVEEHLGEGFFLAWCPWSNYGVGAPVRNVKCLVPAKSKYCLGAPGRKVY